MPDPAESGTPPDTAQRQPGTQPLTPSSGGETWATRAPSSTEPEEVKTAPALPETLPPSLGDGGALPITPVHVPGYEVLGELGRGGMGVVYKARQKGLNRTVALKMILAGVHASSDALNRFRAEAEVIARLHHPNIVQIYQIDECEGRPFFSMEYVDGGSLADHIRGRPQPPRVAAELIESLARAVHVAHEAGIVHRDLKPANILLADNGTRRNADQADQRGSREENTSALIRADPLNPRSSASHSLVPKITDFGLAKRLEEQGQTRSGDVLGTPHYMAPEQAAGRVSQIGPATDIHALGAILYELLTGGPPFGKPTLLDTLAQVREQDPASLRSLRQEVPRDLEVICQKCLRKEPRQRYTSALELADDLRRFLDGESIKARPIRTGEKAVRWVRRHPSATIIGALTLILVPLVVILALRLRGPRLRDYGEAEIRTAAARVRGELFALVRNARTPKGWVRCDLSHTDNPDVESWSHAQSLCVLLSCPDASPAELSEFAGNLELLFTDAERITRKGVRYGWMPHIDSTHTQSEPALWTAAALAVALRRPGLLTGERRKRFEGYLDETHAILKTYAPATSKEGWQMLPNPEDRSCQNTYTNALALLALLETRRAGLGWEGTTQRRDELLAQTAAWLVRYYDAGAEVPGWHKDNKSHEKVIDGLTLQVYSLLLRADTEAGVALPAAIRDQVPAHLMRCARRVLDYPDTSAYTSYPFRNHEGKLVPGKQNLTFLWYPWAVEACVRWLEYARRHGEPAGKTDPVRNVLGYLVVDLGPELTTRGISFVFIPSERLWALCSVPLDGT